jgi:hypothetical protein
MNSIIDIIKKAKPRSVDELAELLSKSTDAGWEILLCYKRGYYEGVKVMIKFTNKVRMMLPEKGVYNIPRGKEPVDKVIFLNDKKLK